jgi:ribonuclease HIII
MSLGLKILSTNLKTWRKYCKENLQKDEMEIESGIEEQKNLKEQVSGSEKKKIGKWRVAPAFNKDIVKQFKEYSPREPEFMKDGYEIGIDEAGRGPVMGPMVYAGLIWPVKLKKKLAAIGFTDSKKLDTEEKREMFFEAIEELRESVVEYKFVSLSSRLISNTTLDKSTAENLNTISFNSAFAII